MLFYIYTFRIEAVGYYNMLSLQIYIESYLTGGLNQTIFLYL